MTDAKVLPLRPREHSACVLIECGPGGYSASVDNERGTGWDAENEIYAATLHELMQLVEARLRQQWRREGAGK